MHKESQLESEPMWRQLYPFQNNFLDIGGAQMHYVDEGQGKPVLFVHGNPTWSFYYRDLISTLRTSCRTVAVDHIGCGLSDKPVTYNYCLHQHIDNLVYLIDDLELSGTTLVAHDWGGAIGLGAVLKRLGQFKSIVLFNTAAFPPPYIPFRIRVCRWPLFGKLAVQGLNAFARAATTMATEQKGGLSSEVAEGLTAPYNNWNNRIALYRFVKDIPMSPTHPTWNVLANIENGLADLRKLPTKLVWGMKDWCFRPDCLERFVQHWPHAEVDRIEDAGHYVVEDASDRVCKLTKQFIETQNVNN